MSSEVHIPIIAEEAPVFKGRAPTERVSICTAPKEGQLVLCEEVRRKHIVVTRLNAQADAAEYHGDEITARAEQRADVPEAQATAIIRDINNLRSRVPARLILSGTSE